MIAACFEIDAERITPDTDLVDLAQSIGDLEVLEWATEAVEREFQIAKPPALDEKGGKRTPRLFLPPVLSVAYLCELAEIGAWPEDWAREGEFVWWPFGRGG